MTTVGDDFPVQQARVRRIQQQAMELGSVGAFLTMVCEQALLRAEKAAISDDLVEILAAYETLREIKE